ncbi:MAG: manganese efflux pump [Oscillospiraceae bacterium]|nr:manganese efflux pump [Oscillospiraceae bacterium]
MFVILEAAVLAASVSLDAFAASFAYGSEKIKIPWQSGQIINLICVFVLGLSLTIGAVVRRWIPEGLTIGLAFGILFVIGLMKLLDGITKSIIMRHNRRNGEGLKKELRFSLLNFSFILGLYANPVEADVNVDKVISPKEAAALAVSLSLDGLAVGFGAAMGSMNVPVVLICAFVINMLAIFLGCRIGKRLARKIPFNISWMSGVILIALAFSHFF